MRCCKPHKLSSWDKCGQPRKTPAGTTPGCEHTHEAYGAAQDGTVDSQEVQVEQLCRFHDTAE